MATGKVKWFNNAKGYGFILPEHGGDDLFAHYSTIQMDGYKTLKAGQDVAFDVESGPKGMHAINIRALTDQGIEAQGADEDGVNGSAVSGERMNGAALILDDATSPMPA
jgi:CspA family cold shock protein